MNYINECLCCGGTSLKSWLDLGNQPPANNFRKVVEELPVYPLVVNFCPNCSHSQLSVKINPPVLFSDYKYVSGTTETLKKHFKELVYDVLNLSINFVIPKEHRKKLNILDIAANDGTLLEIFREEGMNVAGVDPAENLRNITEEKNIPVLVDFWNSNTAFKMGENYDIITACNVFAHVSDPLDFLKGCSRVLAPGGRVIIEFPYKAHLEGDFGQIYHEHISYFTAKSFITLAERAGFTVSNFKRTPIHDGSIRFTLVKNNEPHGLKVRYLIQDEVVLDLDKFQTYNGYQKQLEANLIELLGKVIGLSKNYKIVAYGASAKSSTLLNTKLGKHISSYIDCFVDDNPLKEGLYTPGSDKVIKKVDDIILEKTAWLIMSPNFKDEIRSRLRSAGHYGKIISYSPEVIVEDI